MKRLTALLILLVSIRLSAQTAGGATGGFTAPAGGTNLPTPISPANGGTGSTSVPSAGQVPVGNIAGTAYAPQNKPLNDTRDDPSSGTDIIQRYNNQEIAATNAGVGGESLDGNGEHSATAYNIGCEDWDQPKGALYLDGQTRINPDCSLFQGTFQQIQGVNENIAGGADGTSIVPTANFPATGAVTCSGSSVTNPGQMSCTKASGEVLWLPPGAIILNGDGNRYFVKQNTCSSASTNGCIQLNLQYTTTGPVGCNTQTGGTGTGCLSPSQFSTFYYLSSANAGATTVLVTPNIGTTFGPSTVTVQSPVIALTDANYSSAASASNAFPFVRFSNAYINGINVSNGNCIGGETIFAQENSWFQGVTTSNCAVGFEIAGTDSGPFIDLNAGYLSSNTFCQSGGTTNVIPMEVSGSSVPIQRVTLNGNNCDSARESLGLLHITNSPYLPGVKGGPIYMSDVHMEGSGTGQGTTANGVLIDTANTTNSLTGVVHLHNFLLCPNNFNCTNGFNIASSFAGVLDIDAFNANTGTTNGIADNISSNTPTAANNPNGFGFYERDQSGTATGVWTNVNCSGTDIQNGWCLYSGVLYGIQGNSKKFIVNAGTGQIKSAGLISIDTTFTASGCANSTLVGGASAGTYKSVTAGSCTVTITMGSGLSAPNGWVCDAHDLTTVADANNVTLGSSNATTANLVEGTVAANDIIAFKCMGY